MPNIPRMLTGATVATLSILLHRIGSKNRAWLARQVVNNRKSNRTKALVEFSEKVALAYANAQYDVAINGEKWLLERLALFEPRILLDVGANRGEWCITAYQTNPTATIHAFEIVGDTFQLLKENTKDFRSRIVINDFGLSDKNGKLDIYHTPACDVHSSFLESAHELSSDDVCVRLSRPVRIGDDYLAEKNIPKVDMLKIDVEGAEALVLDGFRCALALHKIDVIQFEYGKHSLLTRYFLKDFYDKLGNYGYLLGKLFPEGIAFKKYEIDDENFIGPNYVACRAERQDIIEAVTLR